jgi:hypothetical protein
MGYPKREAKLANRIAFTRYELSKLLSLIEREAAEVAEVVTYLSGEIQKLSRKAA